MVSLISYLWCRVGYKKGSGGIQKRGDKQTKDTDKEPEAGHAYILSGHSEAEWAEEGLPPTTRTPLG